MPEHDISTEAQFLQDNYERLHTGRSEWVAIVGQEVVDRDVDPVTLSERVDARFGRGSALYASLISLNENDLQR